MRPLRFASLLSFVLLGSLYAQTQGSGVLGYWREPGGSVLSIEPCGGDVCARLVSVSKDAPATRDVHNPDLSLRTRPLCGLIIGSGFHLASPMKAEDGSLYDPKSGKTYKGAMSSDGDVLHLRGYVGIKAFGRSETWQRTSAPPAACS